MSSHAPSNKPNLSSTSFWDIDMEAIDFEADSLFVMGKVMNYGLWNDIVEMLRFYGLKRVRREIVQGSYYKKTALSFLCLILDLEESDFTAYQRRQARGVIWDY